MLLRGSKSSICRGHVNQWWPLGIASISRSLTICTASPRSSCPSLTVGLHSSSKSGPHIFSSVVSSLPVESRLGPLGLVYADSLFSLNGADVLRSWHGAPNGSRGCMGLGCRIGAEDRGDSVRGNSACLYGEGGVWSFREYVGGEATGSFKGDRGAAHCAGGGGGGGD